MEHSGPIEQWFFRRVFLNPTVDRIDGSLGTIPVHAILIAYSSIRNIDSKKLVAGD
jgi:hypothetical protein